MSAAEPHAFSQRDPRWREVRLGASALTISEAGCLLTVVASLLADWGVETDPQRLNSWLMKRRGYLPPAAGGSACRFVFGSVEPLGARLRSWVDCYSTPANLARVARTLSDGGAVLALVDARPGCEVQAHWVRLLEVQKRDCLIMDPWQLPGAELGSLVKWYGSGGWDAGRAIFVIAAYERMETARQARIEQGRLMRTQSELCWRNLEAVDRDN